ncbi:MAG: GntR family transcriptional regulator [Burkholderiales bacterium]
MTSPAQRSTAPAPSATLTEVLRLRIERAICERDFVPGEMLCDKDIAERYATSRTPAREALLMLAATGMVEMIPRSGMYVARMGPKDLAAATELLAELECFAARLAARRMTAAQRQRLLQIQEANAPLAAANDVAAYNEGNRALHDAIYAGSANPLLATQIHDLRKRLSIYHQNPFANPGRLAHSQREHGEFVQAIVAGDGDAAHVAMERHINNGGQALVDLLMTAR